MLALPEDRAPTPYFLEESDSVISLKAHVVGKMGKDVPANICLFNKRGIGNYKANAEFVLRACNAFENCLEILRFFWEARASIDDTGARGIAEKTPELEAFIESAGDILYPEGGRAPVKLEAREEKVATSVSGPADGAEEGQNVDPNHGDLAVTDAKIKAWEKI